MSGEPSPVARVVPDPNTGGSIGVLTPFRKLGLLARRILHLLARPVPRRRGLVIHPYRGYGSPHEVFLRGRVLRQPGTAHVGPSGKLGRDLLNVLRRFLRRGGSGLEVEARMGKAATRVMTDEDGYFRVRLESVEGGDSVDGGGSRSTGGPRAPGDSRWRTVELEVVKAEGVRATGQVFVASLESPFVVISDIDDTVVHTGVASKARMFWNMFLQGADTRVAFPGVAAFYRALHRGPSGTDRNPMLYVSRGPWSLYEVLEAFFRLHDIPDGPVLFLRDWGFTLRHPLPRLGRGHKEGVIREILRGYPDHPFVLVGDSGQRDPETYARVVRENPGRILAVYIRNVSRTPERDEAVRALSREVEAAGSSLVLADDTFVMARHAAEEGLIAPDALEKVLTEREAGQE